jgi:dienelactone hydrolase
MMVMLMALAVVASAGTAQEVPTDEWLVRPVDDATFTAYLEFFRYQTQVPFETVVLSSATEDGVLVEHVSFQTTLGTRVIGRLFRPADVDPGEVASVIVLPNAGANGKDSGRFWNMGRLLARAGIQMIAIDMLHYGERNDGLFPTFSTRERHELLYNNEPAYLEWVQQTVKDVGRTFDFLVQERGADRRRIGIVGESRGAVLGLIAAGADERLAAVALLHAGHFDSGENGHLPAACPANYIGRINPRPLMMVNGERDVVFAPETAIRPLQLLAQDHEHFRWNDGSHTAMTEEDWSALVSFLRESLR